VGSLSNTNSISASLVCRACFGSPVGLFLRDELRHQFFEEIEVFILVGGELFEIEMRDIIGELVDFALRHRKKLHAGIEHAVALQIPAPNHPTQAVRCLPREFESKLQYRPVWDVPSGLDANAQRAYIFRLALFELSIDGRCFRIADVV